MGVSQGNGAGPGSQEQGGDQVGSGLEGDQLVSFLWCFFEGTCG
jgi:hypothetical protein